VSVNDRAKVILFPLLGQDHGRIEPARCGLIGYRHYNGSTARPAKQPSVTDPDLTVTGSGSLGAWGKYTTVAGATTTSITVDGPGTATLTIYFQSALGTDNPDPAVPVDAATINGSASGEASGWRGR
jgi:hypothetical protein